MAFKLNPLTGRLDVVNSASGFVVGPSTATDKAIARYDGTTGKLIQDSPGTRVQDSGAIVAQGHITDKLIIGEVVIGSDQCMITSGFSIELTGELVIEADGELVVL